MVKMFKKMDAAFFLKAMEVIFCITFVGLIFWGGADYLNSDSTSSDMIAHEVGSYGPGTFKDFASQAAFTALNVLYWLPKVLLNRIIPDVLLVDMICAGSFYIIFLISVYFFAKKIVGGGENSLALLCCGLSTSWMSISVLELLYSIYLIYMMVFLYLSCYLINRLRSKWGKKERLILCTLVLFIIYILSYDQRFAAVFIGPFCAAILACGYIENYSSRSLKELTKGSSKKYIILFCGIAFGLVCGLLINAILKSTLPFYAGGASPIWFTFADFSKLFDQIAIQIQSVFQLWGVDFSQSVSTISLISVGYIIKAAICVCVMWVFPLLCVFQYKTLPTVAKILMISYWGLVAEIFYVYGLSVDNTVGTSRYFVFEVIFAILISAYFIDEKLIKPHNLNRYIVAIAILLFGTVSQLGTYKDLRELKDSGLLDSRKQLVAQLEADDLSYGYATWWNAQILSSISDYEVEILPVILGQGISPHFSFNFIHRFAPNHYSGNTFLLLTMEEYQNMQNGDVNPFLDIGEPDRMYDYGGYVVCIYDHNIAEDSPLFPYDYYYSPINGTFDIGQEVQIENSCEMSSVGEVNVYRFPVDIESDSFYQVKFSVETDSAPELFYMDFEGTPIESVNLEDMDPTARGITYESGQKNYKIIIPSGSTMDTSKDVYLRIVCTPTSGVAIKNIEMNVLELYNIN